MPPPKKRLGQHFLHDPGILRRIADALEADPADTVLEIGPGLGGLTAHLVGRAAPPGGSEYGALSVGVRSVARVERLFTVGAGAFRPRPKVDSAVLRLTPLEQPLVTDAEVLPFRRFVVGLFGFRRKQLVRGLRELTGSPAEEVLQWLAAANLVPTMRPQELSPADFVRLYQASRG